MLSKDTGKKINRIKIGKSKVSIFFADEKLDISPNTYTEFHLFPNKCLSAKDIKAIKDRDSLESHYSYILKSLERHSQSEKNVREKLLNRGAKPKQIEFIISELYRYSLLDDGVIAKEGIEYANYKHYGYNRLVDDLKKKNVAKATIDKYCIYDEQRELKNAKALLPSLDKKYAVLNYEERKHHVYEALVRYGYSFSIASVVIDSIAPRDEKIEMNALQKDYEKALAKYAKKCSDKETSTKVINYLMSKGYRYSDIAKIKK